MKRKKFKKQTYVRPTTEVIHIPFEGQPLLITFSNGGHNKADNDEVLHAKQGFFDEDEEEEDAPQPWGLQ